MATVGKIPYRTPVLRTATTPSAALQQWVTWRAQPGQAPGDSGPVYAVRQALATVLQETAPAIAQRLFSPAADDVRTGYAALQSTAAESVPAHHRFLAFVFLVTLGTGAHGHLFTATPLTTALGKLAAHIDDPDSIIALLLHAFDGHQSATARALGVGQPGICKRLQRATAPSPLADPDLPKRGNGSDRKYVPWRHVTDTEIADALHNHQGTQSDAARALGINPSTIRNRRRHAGTSSPLSGFVFPTRKGSRKKRGPCPDRQKVSDAAIAAALRTHHGNQTAAARELKVAQKTINIRVRRAVEPSPLAEPDLPKRGTRGGKKGAPHPGQQKVSDAAIATALRKQHGNQTAAARALGVSVVTIWKRLKRAVAPSPLADPDLPKGTCGGKKGVPHPGKQKVSDAAIAAALRIHHGNQSATARALGVSPSAIISRRRSANTSSPLADSTLPKKWPRGRNTRSRRS